MFTPLPNYKANTGICKCLYCSVFGEDWFHPSLMGPGSFPNRDCFEFMVHETPFSMTGVLHPVKEIWQRKRKKHGRM